MKYQLTSVEGVAEVASIGGFVKQYQVTVDPTKLRATISQSPSELAVKKANGEVGGRSIELAEKEFILRVRGYISSVEDLRKVAVGLGENGVPILLGEVANVQLGPEMRRGIAGSMATAKRSADRGRAVRRERAPGDQERKTASRAGMKSFLPTSATPLPTIAPR